MVGPKIFGWTRNGVEYRLSAIPFGGYVALPQLVDMGRLEGKEEIEHDSKPFKSWDEDEETSETNSKPLPKISYADKMIVSVMGAVFNILLAFSLACVLSLFGYDVPDSQLTTKIGYVAEKVERWNPLVEEGEEVTGPALKAGLLVGDEILAVDGGYVENFMDILNHIVTGKQRMARGKKIGKFSRLRDGKEIKIEVYPEVVGREEIRVIGIGPQETFFIESLEPDMPAIKAGLEVGDQPIRIDNQKIHSFSQLVAYLNQSDINQTISFAF